MAEPWGLSLAHPLTVTLEKSLNVSISALVNLEKNNRTNLLNRGEDDKSDCM